jgi:hypothetical protein
VRLKRWQALGIIAILGGSALVFGLDLFFKAQVRTDDHNLSVVAESGVLSGRRALFLSCAGGRNVALVARARLGGPQFVGLASAAGAVLVSSVDHSRGPTIKTILELKIRMTLTAIGWVHTLKSDELTAETLKRFAEAIADPSASRIAVHTMERGIYFDLTSGPADRSSLVAACLSR